MACKKARERAQAGLDHFLIQETDDLPVLDLPSWLVGEAMESRFEVFEELANGKVSAASLMGI